MNKTEVMEQLVPITSLAIREVDHSAGTKVIANPEVISIRPSKGSRLLEVTKEGAKSLAKFAGLPTSIEDKISPDTFGRVTTELLGDKGRYDLMLKDGQVVDIIPPTRYRNVNPDRVLTAIEQSGGVEFNRVLILQDHSAQLEAVAAEQQAVVRGDLIRAGALVAFSPIGTIEPYVQSYVLRLACTNGAITNTVLTQFKFKDNDGNLWSWFRKSVRDSIGAVGAIAARWKELSEEQITPEDRVMVLEGMVKAARLSIEVEKALRARALQQPPENSYDILNLVTWATSHVIRNPMEVVRARRAAAEFAEASTHERLCPVCHRQR